MTYFGLWDGLSFLQCDLKPWSDVVRSKGFRVQGSAFWGYLPCQTSIEPRVARKYAPFKRIAVSTDPFSRAFVLTWGCQCFLRIL